MRRDATFLAMVLMAGILLAGCKSPFSADKGGGAARLLGPAEDGPEAGGDPPDPAGGGTSAGSRGKDVRGP